MSTLARSGFGNFIRRPFLHNPDLLFRQPVQFVDQPVNLAVGGVNLALLDGLIVGSFGGGQLPVQGQHTLDRRRRGVLLPFSPCFSLPSLYLKTFNFSEMLASCYEGEAML